MSYQYTKSKGGGQILVTMWGFYAWIVVAIVVY